MCRTDITPASWSLQSSGEYRLFFSHKSTIDVIKAIKTQACRGVHVRHILAKFGRFGEAKSNK